MLIELFIVDAIQLVYSSQVSHQFRAKRSTYVVLNRPSLFGGLEDQFLFT